METAGRIAAEADDRSASGVAAAVNRLIRCGEFPPGTRLPTVRELASALQTSPTTVNEAWRSLSRLGAIRTEGRKGSFVADQPGTQRPTRFWQLAGEGGRFACDLSTGVPDPDLLPTPHNRVAGAGTAEPLLGYLDPPVVGELEEALREAWRELWEPEAVTVVDGSLDALDRVLRHVVSFGARVVVEDPTFPPILDLLDVLGASVLGVGVDQDGMRPDRLRDVLRQHAGTAPAAIVLQPRAHNPTGASVTRRRARELADVVSEFPDVTVVEDDHIGAVALAEQVSLASHLPDRTVHIRSFSKSHGPDLRLAAVAGPAELIEAVVARRSLGPAWSSRLLQRLLHTMLTDPASVATVDRAREVYARRRRALVDALAERGVPVPGKDGFNLWVPVADERDALVLLAARGIGVAPGKPFAVAKDSGDHLRITTATLRTEDAPWIADAVAEAASPRRRGPIAR